MAIEFTKDIEKTQDLDKLKNIKPIVLQQHYDIEYIISYAQDSPFFAGLVNGKLLGTKCKGCGYAFATPRKHCMECGSECDWVELPHEGKIHAWTTCYFGGQEFLDETPFNLILVEFEGFNTLFLSRLIGASDIKVGMPVKAEFKKDTKIKVTDVYFVLK